MAGSAVRVIQGGCGAPSLKRALAPLRGACRPENFGVLSSSDRDFPRNSTLHFGLPRRPPEAERTRTASAALAAIGGAAAAAAGAAGAEQAPVRIELHTREAAPPRSRRPPGGHDTGRERGGCGRAPGSVAGAAATAAAALLLVDPETQDEWRRKEMPKKSRALGPPQAMMKRTIQRAAGEEKFASALCKRALCTTG